MRFLVDAQLPPALARWLVSQGHEALHVADLGMVSASDRLILNKAIEMQAVIVSKDEDFIHLSAKGGPQLVWITFGNTGKSLLIEKMSKALPQIMKALALGESIVEVR